MTSATLRASVPLALALVFACGDPESGRAPGGPDPHVASASCPLKSPSDWEAFLHAAVEDDHWVSTCSDLQNCNASLGAFREHVLTSVVSVLESCSADIAENPPIERCTERLRRYVPAWLAQHVDDSYGFKQDNPTYFASHVAPDLPPGMMDPPHALLEAFPERAALESAAGLNGWPYLTHRSCLGGTRTFVTVADPEGRFDQWMLFGLDATQTAAENPGILSFIGVQKKNADNSPLDRVRLHFRDYVVTADSEGPTLELPENFGGKCYACHPTGLRELISAPESAALNERMKAYVTVDWNGTIDPADHGPPLGASLGCTECHNGEDRGVLSVSTSEGMLWQKVVEQLSMRSPRDGRRVPDEAAMALLEREKSSDPPLTPDEVLALEQARAEHLADYEVLVAERFPAWRDWALGVACQ